MKNALKFLLLNAIALVIALSFSSCGDDDPDPVFTAPELSISGDTQVTLKPGAAITVNFDINAEGGISSIIVNRNGGFLEEVDITDTQATTFEYTGQTVASTAVQAFSIVTSQDQTDGRPTSAHFLTFLPISRLEGSISRMKNLQTTLFERQRNGSEWRVKCCSSAPPAKLNFCLRTGMTGTATQSR